MEFARVDNTQGDPPAELAGHFQGRARLQRLVNPFPGDDPSVFAVYFEPGGRTKPHMHGRGQLLHIAAGEGIIGTVDGRRHVTAGDVVSVMPNEWHWHGATPTTPMTHVTVQPSGPGSVDWNVDERDWAEEYS